jgi:hypothetical protein
MGVDYYSENAEISSFTGCVYAIITQISAEAFEKVKEATHQFFLNAIQEEQFVQYAEKKDLKGELEEILSSYQTITFEEKEMWPHWSLSIFDYYNEVFDDSDFAARLWEILIDNCEIENVKNFRSVGVTYLRSGSMNEDLENISEDEVYLTFGFDRYRKVLTSKAKAFVAIFGQDNLPEDASWVWISC